MKSFLKVEREGFGARGLGRRSTWKSIKGRALNPKKPSAAIPLHFSSPLTFGKLGMKECILLVVLK